MLNVNLRLIDYFFSAFCNPFYINYSVWFWVVKIEGGFTQVLRRSKLSFQIL